MKYFFAFLLFVTGNITIAQTIPDPADYHIQDAAVTEKVLRNYLKRNISITGLADLNPNVGNCSSKFTAAGTLERVDGIEYKRWMEFIQNTHPKMINGLAGLWGNGDLWYYYHDAAPCDHFEQCRKTAEDIHAIDQQIICGASIDEEIGVDLKTFGSNIYIPVPAATLAVYPLPSNGVDAFGKPVVRFNAADMFYQAGAAAANGGAVPDISKQMSLAWYYYLGCKYIDAGYELIRIGQVHLIGKEDEIAGWENLYRLLENLRAYAKTVNPATGRTNARRGFVLFDGGYNKFGLHYKATDYLIFDLHSAAINLKETYARFKEDRGVKAKGDGMQAGSDYEALIDCSDGIYGQTLGGTHPCFGPIEHNLFFVEFDNSIGSPEWYVTPEYPHPPHPNNDCHYPWSWDESTWYSQQSQLYRDDLLRYLWHRVRCLDQNGYLSMLGRRGIQAWVNGPKETYCAYDSTECCAGYNQEETIKNIWDANDARKPEFVNGKSTKLYKQWANNFVLKFIGHKLPEGKLYFGDFTGDGEADILETADKSKDQHWSGWRLYRQNGNSGTFSLQNSGGWPSWGEQFYIGDFNGDGKDDFVVTANKKLGVSWEGWHLYLSTGTEFTSAYSGIWPSFKQKIYPGDFNGDGKSDLLCTNNKVVDSANDFEGYKVCFSTGSGFEKAPGNSWQNSSPSGTERYHIGDFNGDGKDDFIVSGDRNVKPVNTLDGFKVFLSQVSVNNFTLTASARWPSWDEDFVIGDWNGDGRDDISTKAILHYAPYKLNWEGVRTYLANESGTHFQFAFERPGPELNNTEQIFRKPDSSGDDLIAISNGVYNYYSVERCSDPATSGIQAKTVSAHDSNVTIEIHPNPSDGLFLFSSSTDFISQLIVADMRGHVVLFKEVGQKAGSLDLASFPPGVYIVSFVTPNGTSQRKLTKK